jgi:hypothetical protein
MDYNLKIDIMKIIRLIIAGIFIVMGFLAFSQSPGNFSTLRVTTLNGNMKANGTSLVTADTVLLKADTVRADAELYVRDSTIDAIIDARAQSVNILNNANNRVTTATGNANELQAEANLTFDGSTLTLTGTQLTTVQSQISATTNQIRFGTTNTVTMSVTAPTVPRVYTVPNAQDNANFAMTDQGVVSRIPYWANSGKMQNSTNFTYDGTTFTITGTSGSGNTAVFSATGSGSSVSASHSGSGNGITINQTGSGSGLVVTNSGGGVALQAENITVDGNTIGSSNTDGNIVIQPNGTGQVNIGSQGNRRVITFFGAASGTTQFLGVRNNSGVERFRFLYNNDSPTLVIADETSAVSWDFVRSSGTFRVNNGNLIVAVGSVGTTGTRITSSFFTNITSTNAVVVDSDSTLKQNIIPITNATEKVLAINPVEYTWKSDSLNKVHYGVIAQEINEVLPNIVISNGETLGVAYGEIIPYLIAAIKELEARVKQLEGN